MPHVSRPGAGYRVVDVDMRSHSRPPVRDDTPRATAVVAVDRHRIGHTAVGHLQRRRPRGEYPPPLGGPIDNPAVAGMEQYTITERPAFAPGHRWASIPVGVRRQRGSRVEHVVVADRGHTLASKDPEGAAATIVGFLRAL